MVGKARGVVLWKWIRDLSQKDCKNRKNLVLSSRSDRVLANNNLVGSKFPSYGDGKPFLDLPLHHAAKRLGWTRGSANANDLGLVLIERKMAEVLSFSDSPENRKKKREHHNPNQSRL